MSPKDYSCVSTTKVSPFGLAVLPASGNIYMNVLIYHIDNVYASIILEITVKYLNPSCKI